MQELIIKFQKTKPHLYCVIKFQNALLQTSRKNNTETTVLSLFHTLNEKQCRNQTRYTKNHTRTQEPIKPHEK